MTHYIIEQLKKELERPRGAVRPARHTIQVEDGWIERLIERVQELEGYTERNSEKTIDLNLFLQERDIPEYLGLHVIDAVMGYVQELEKQNKRYREAIDKMEEVVVFTFPDKVAVYEIIDILSELEEQNE